MERDVHVLVVEDEVDGLESIRVALANLELFTFVHTVESGAQALAFVRNEGVWRTAPKPTVILMDLRMPGMDGVETLEALRSLEGASHIPVLLLSGSRDEVDVARAYSAGANCLVTRPEGLRELQSLLGEIFRFWLTVPRLVGP